MQHLNIGPIIEGTMRAEDTLPALADALESVATAPGTVRDDSELTAIEDARRVADRLDNEVTHDADAHEAASEVFEDLIEYLQGFAPDYTRVGTLDGDGASLGVWPDWEQIEMDQHDGELIRIDAGEERPEPEPDGPVAILEVTDHGNCALFLRVPNADCEPPRDEWREVWSIV